MKKFSLKRHTVNRILKRIRERFEEKEKELGRQPTIRELGRLQILKPSDRIWFVFVGLFFMGVAVVALIKSVWWAALLIGPPSAYVAYRGFFGHSVDIIRLLRSTKGKVETNIEREIDIQILTEEIEKNATTRFVAFFMVELFLGIVLAILEMIAVILEMIVAVLTALFSIFG